MEEEIARLSEELEKLHLEVEKINQKLEFLSKTVAEMKEKEKQSQVFLRPSYPL